MFSREKSQGGSYKKWIAGAFVAGCAVGSYMYLNQEEQAIEVPEAVENMELVDEEEPVSFEEIIDETLEMNKASRCNTIRSSGSNPVRNAYPNFGALSRGYNIYKGSPFGKTDQGFSSRLFSFDWHNPHRDSTGKSYPRDTNVLNNSRCSSATTTKTSQDEKELQSSYATSVSVGGGGGYGGFSASFKASTDFKEQKHEMNKGEKASALATASCIVSVYSIKRIDPPCLSSEAMKYINMLTRNPNDHQLLNDFFDNFGTHVINSVEMGDKFVSKTTFNRREMYKQKALGRGVSFSAEAGGFGFSASNSVSTRSDSDNKQRNKSSFSSMDMYTIGTPLPGGRNVADQLAKWIANKGKIIANPQPVGHMQLTPIPDAFKYAFHDQGLRSSQHTAVLRSMKEHLKNRYCASLKSRNLIDDCAAGKALGAIHVRKYRVGGHPISSGRSGWGKNVMCDDNAVVTEQCGGGSNRDCNGSSTTGRCERFEGIDSHKKGFWMNQHTYGRYTECRTGAVSGMCTSGENRDCGGYVHRIFCNAAMKVDRGHCQNYAQSNWHRAIKCRSGYVMIGRGASGGNMDARISGFTRHKYATVMRCCRAVTSPLYRVD